MDEIEIWICDCLFHHKNIFVVAFVAVFPSQILHFVCPKFPLHIYMYEIR